MKNARKLASLLLAIVLVFALATTAFAATGDSTTTGTITVTNTVKDVSYSIYRIFDLESFSDDTPDAPPADGAYSYKVNSNWSNFINQSTIKGVYVNVDANGYVTWVANASAADFAAAAIAYATADATKIDPVETKTASSDKEEVKFSDLPLGYYLVDSSLGALCALNTTNPDATVIEKNSNPSLVKEVKEDSTGDWGDKDDAEIGEDVEFKATITVQGFAKDYVMHDKMDDGLTYKAVSSVTLNGNTVTASGNYEVVTTTNDQCTFEVKFSETFCNSLATGDVIVVSYKATLNDNAVVKEPENNSAHLEYKDNNGDSHTTTPDTTQTFTWELPVLKYANGDTTKVLAGAKFSLYTDATCENLVKFREVKESDKTTVYRVDPNGTVTEITTDSTGRFRIEGLDAGTYYLKETEAPTGYNKLNTVVTVTIDHDGKIDIGAKNDDDNIAYVTEVQVENKAGTELPATGGMGTTLFYVLGGVLVVGAVVLLVTKKRMSAEK